MCDYCGERRDLIVDGGNGNYLRVTIHEGYITAKAAFGNHLKVNSAGIRFCPVCGREMEVDR